MFYRRLLSVCDDYGLYDTRPIVLRAAMFPLRYDRMSNSDIQGCHNKLVELGLVRVYEADGRQYGQVVKFGQQYKSYPKYPIPPWADPEDYQPETKKKKKSVTKRNAKLRSVTKRHLDEYEYEEEKTLLSESLKESTADAVETAGSAGRTRPHSEKDVERLMRNTPGLMLTEDELIKCAACFFNDSEARDWRDAKGCPIWKWEPAARSYAMRWQSHANSAPASNRRAATPPTSTRQGCNDPSDYR